MFESLKLNEVSSQERRILRRRTNTRPTLWTVEEDGRRAVVKDFSQNAFLFRNTAGRFLIWREKKAYERLGNLSGVPMLYRVIDGIALVIQEIPGRNLRDLEEGTEPTLSFFHALAKLVDECHRRGLAHCDLKRAPNILMGFDGRPYIVDWGASISKREFGFFPLNRIYRRFLLDDQLAIIKLKLRHFPEAVTPDEWSDYNRRSLLEKWIRVIRDGLRRVLRKVV
jgi:serine/threonine protein kinase